MDFHTGSDRRRAFSKSPAFAGFSDRLVNATTEMRRLAQQLNVTRVPQPRRDPQAVGWTSPVKFFKPNACRDCQHYYGLGHGRDLLICAMHPYGPEADLCEDRKALDLD